MSSNNLTWQTRDEMPCPTNALQKLVETMTMTSKDMGQDKMTAFIYGVVVGWDDKAYVELAERHDWSQFDIDYQKQLHENYNRAWTLNVNEINSEK